MYFINRHSCMHTTRQISIWSPMEMRNLKTPRQRLVGIQSMFFCIDSGMFKSIATDNIDHSHTLQKSNNRAQVWDNWETCCLVPRLFVRHCHSMLWSRLNTVMISWWCLPNAAINLLCHIVDLIDTSGVNTVAHPWTNLAYSLCHSLRKILPIMEYGVSVRGSQSPVGEIIEQATLCSYTEDIYGIVTPFQGKRKLN